MLEYVKLILEKVSFDQHLFEKELKKSIKQLRSIKEDLEELKKWCFEKFANRHEKILQKCFAVN
jgi:hypothetical protein